MILNDLASVIDHRGIDALLFTGLSLNTPIKEWQTAATRHRLFLLSLAGHHHVLRVEPDEALAPGVDHAREQVILDRIQRFTWAPSVQVNCPAMGVIMMSHAGLVNEVASIDLARVCQALSDVHTIDDVPRLHYAELFQQYRNALAHEGFRQLIDDTELTLSCLPDIGECLVHHDLHEGNLCWHNGWLTIIDWEYAGLGNPWLDYAVLARDLQADRSTLQGFSRLKSLSESEFNQGIAAAIGVVDQLETIWHHYQQIK